MMSGTHCRREDDWEDVRRDWMQYFITLMFLWCWTFSSRQCRSLAGGSMVVG